RTKEATFDRAKADYERAKAMYRTSSMSREEFDLRLQDVRVAEASLDQARQTVHQTRVALGLSPEPEKDKSLNDVPPDLTPTYSPVRTALTECTQTLTQLGLPLGSTNLTPKQAIDEFLRLNISQNLDQILRDLIPKAPAVLQAKAELQEARHALAQAELNLRY